MTPRSTKQCQVHPSSVIEVRFVTDKAIKQPPDREQTGEICDSSSGDSGAFQLPEGERLERPEEALVLRKLGWPL